MTYRYLLDTNILSDLVRQLQGRVFQRIITVGEDSVCTSIIVACELLKSEGEGRAGIKAIQFSDRFSFMPQALS